MYLINPIFCGCNKSVNFSEFWLLEIRLLTPSYRYSLDSCYVGWHWVSGWTGCQSIRWLTHGDKQRFPLAFTPSGCGGTKRKCAQANDVEHGNSTEKHFFCESFLFSLADLKEQMQETKGFFICAAMEQEMQMKRHQNCIMSWYDITPENCKIVDIIAKKLNVRRQILLCSL